MVSLLCGAYLLHENHIGREALLGFLKIVREGLKRFEFFFIAILVYNINDQQSEYLWTSFPNLI